MTSRIRVLDPVTVSKISAGEVVERPASVVKEMLENSIDAGANAITVEIRDGGSKYLRVTDDGCGISHEDIPNLFKRHATSKLTKLDDLEQLGTLGFRGEALASIASVCRLELTSSPDGVDGSRVRVEGGVVLESAGFGCAKGTTIKVSDLFFNTPARRKFLKSKATETNHVIDIVTRYALAHPQIHIRLIVDGATAIDSPTTRDQKENIASVYGAQVGKAMREVRGDGPGVKVHGHTSAPETEKGSSSYISIFVNHRYVRSPGIVQAILDGYQTRLMKHRYPVCVLFVEVDPSAVDVNIHPTKTEVRFASERMVLEAVRAAVADALKETSAPLMELRQEDLLGFEAGAIVRSERSAKLGPAPKNENIALKRSSPDARQVPLTVDEAGPAKHRMGSYIDIPPELFSTSQVPSMRPLGQVHNTYIVAETKEGMLIIDQHAAAERVNLERLEDAMGGGKAIRQQLITPLSIGLDKKQMNILLENREALGEFGFELEEFGKDAILIRSVPVVLSREVGKDVLGELLEEIVGLGHPHALDKFKDEVSHIVACKASVRAGDPMTPPQVEELILRLYGARKPYSCAHGRPTILSLSKTDLEKRFKRIV